ncbi:MAG: c-type cytochrome [Nitrospina sp.]|nr:MAG: c-type cytochrome [Nitrospina sp.]
MNAPKKICGMILICWGLWGQSLWAEPALQTAPAWAEVEGCATCHRFSPNQPESTAPDLFYAGNKFQQDWLVEYLQRPTVIRQAGHTRDPGFLQGQPDFTGPHPVLKPKDAATLAAALMTLKLPDLETVALATTPLSEGKKVRIKILFERDYSCIACHESYNLARQPRGGVSGPSLIDAGNRLQAEWVYLWLQQPKIFLKKGRMPVYQFDEETLLNLTRYIASHKKESGNKN